ncbi:MAG: ATP-binding protein [Bifidobacteriaceae bacterium]|nr:ATP-binding protein [Bifidobacteriaceae bacterium]
MNVVGGLSDIPKVYTALAEWLFSLVCVLACLRRAPKPRECAWLAASLAVLVALQIVIGVVPVAFWLPGMGVAVLVMFLTIWRCGSVSTATGAFLAAKAFLLAEAAASLEWQLHFYLSTTYMWGSYVWVGAALLVVVYGAVFGIALALELRQADSRLETSWQELWWPAAITIATFALSNLSYVSPSTPFSSPVGADSFNIRTLVGVGGVAFLYAYQNHLLRGRAKAETDTIRVILRLQHAQYQQHKESRDLIDHKYHDLKHQIAVLRGEIDPARRKSHLDEIERGVHGYGSQLKTGNAALDTVLTSKALACADHSIQLTCAADGALLDHVSEMDVCAIFGNALDNAIECVRQIPSEDKRLVHVSVSRFKTFALVRVNNYMADAASVRLRDGLPITTKADSDYHGFGLKSVRHVVNKYGGNLTTEVKDNWFEFKVLLPAPASACPADQHGASTGRPPSSADPFAGSIRAESGPIDL